MNEEDKKKEENIKDKISDNSQTNAEINKDAEKADKERDNAEKHHGKEQKKKNIIVTKISFMPVMLNSTLLRTVCLKQGAFMNCCPDPIS